MSPSRLLDFFFSRFGVKVEVPCSLSLDGSKAAFPFKSIDVLFYSKSDCKVYYRKVFKIPSWSSVELDCGSSDLIGG